MGVADYSKTPASNTAINAIGIAGANSVQNFDNALRQLMADIATAREDGALASMPYATKSSGYTLASTDRGKLIECTAAVEIELLAAASATGFYFIAKANGGAVTLDPNGSENINGSSTSLVVADGTSAIVACNGTAWFAVIMGQGNGDVTTSGTQTLTNKKLVDASTTVVGSGDATKQLRFEVDGNTTATTRVVTARDSDGTMAYTADFLGKQTLPLLPGAWTDGATPPARVNVSMGSKVISALSFDTSQDEEVYFSFRAPKSSAEGTLTFDFVWSHPATTTNFGVAFFLEVAACGNDDASSQAFGTAVEVDDTGGTTDDIYISPESSAVTPGGTWAEGDLLICRFYRDVSDTADNLAVDARVHQVNLYITNNAAKDD